MAKIIACFNQKGGSGKTNTAMQLAGTFGKRGYRTAIVDLDPQGTASQWVSMAEEEHPFPASLLNLAPLGGKMHREVRNHVDNYDVIVIDCPPAIDSPAPSSALLIADLALIPVIPSPSDIWAAVAARSLAAKSAEINEGLIIRVLANMVQSTTLAGGAIEMLEADKDAPLLKTRIGLRSGYRECQLTGSTVHDLPRNQQARAEVNQLADEISVLIKLGKPTARKGD